MKKIVDHNLPLTKSSIVLFCVIRDEEILLPHFINHYQSIGVTHFVFIDNNSEDQSVKTILENNASTELWKTNQKYSSNSYGVGWVNKLLKSFYKKYWCVVVDADEFLLLKNENLNSLREIMLETSSNVLETVLIDLYPKKQNLTQNPYNPSLYNYCYDIFNEDFLSSDIALDNSRVVKGGFRRRIFKIGDNAKSSVCLNKKSFFYNDFYKTHELSVGMHWILPLRFDSWENYDHKPWYNQSIRYYKSQAAIAHLKFTNQDLVSHIKTRIQRNEDWDNSQEYKEYLSKYTKAFYSDRFSRKFTSVSNLYKDTLEKLK